MGAFLNVVMINLSYDVPVKLFSIAPALLQRVPARPRLQADAGLHGAEPERATDRRMGYLVMAQPWHRWVAVAVKLFIVYQILWLPLKNGWTRYQALKAPAAPGPFRSGFYDVRHYVVNSDTIPAASARHASLEGRHHRQRAGREREHARRRVLAALSARVFPLQAGHGAEHR